MDVERLVAARQKALEFLRGARNADGSWGYLAGGEGSPEPTLHAAAAGAGASVAWLSSSDLGWGWLLVPASLRRVDEAAALRAEAVERILGMDVHLADPEDPPNPDVAHDSTIPSWPWIDGTSPWVEPTAYAIVSLRAAGRADHPRVADGRRMLADRQCFDGGWNYGNPEVYGEELEGELVPTAWATMALAPGPEVERSLPYLLGALKRPSVLGLSLATLARVAHGAPVDELLAALVARQGDDGSFGGRCERTALAACALGAALEGSHVYGP